MRSESPEKRVRQKVAEPPSYRIENEYNPEAIPQYFQISVGVLEGRNYTWLNSRSANSYVIIVLGKKKCRTTIRRNKQEPHYGEYFAFDMYASLYDVQCSTLTLTVMEPRCCAPPHLLGEANIDLGAVWRQPHFPKMFPKWIQLSLPRGSTAGSMGFLRVDISITFKSGVQVKPPFAIDNNIEVNYLLSSGSEQQQANYIITVHGAFGLPNTSRYHNDRYHCVKPPHTFVRVLFCGLQAKTSVQKHTNYPMYNEQVSIVEMFPSSNPVFRFEICSTDTFVSRLLASKSLSLDHMSHDGENGFLPTFGPSLLPMFGSSFVGNFTPNGDSPFYRGSLLISFRTVVPYYQQSLRSINVEPVVPISIENLWTLKTFCIFCPIFEVSMLDSRLVGDYSGIAVTIGEIPIAGRSDEELTYMMNAIKTRKLHYTGSLGVLRTKSEFGYVDFSNTYPVIQSTVQLPDYRFRIYRNNAINRIVCTLKSTLNNVEHRLKNRDYATPKDLLHELNRILDNIACNILQYLNSNSNNACGNTEGDYQTELDKKQLSLQMEEMKKIRGKILHKCTLNMSESNCEVTRRYIKSLLPEMHALTRHLEKLIFKATEGWPDIVIWLLNDGSRIGFCKIPIADVIFSNIPEECGAICGQIKSIYFKPLKCSNRVNSLSMGCFCDVGKVELLAWLGLHEQRSAFEPYLPNGYKLKIKDVDMCVKCNGILVECRAFIYKARLLCDNPCDLGHVYLRIYALNIVQETKVIEKSATSVWNQLLRIKKIIYTSSDRLMRHPPIVFVEMNSTNLMGKTDLIGSFQMEPVIDDREAYIPKLRWYEIYKGMENTGKILMSVQILPVPETILKSTVYTTFQECFMASDMKEFEDSNTDPTHLPTDLMPKTSTYKLDIYWWGLRNLNITKKPCVVIEIEDLIVKSDIIAARRINCNFHNGRVSQIFEASFNEHFCPLINIILFDNCTFGRTLYIGKSIVRKPDQFIVRWYTKMERDASLKHASILPENFLKVNQTLYVKKKIESRKYSELSCSSTNIGMKRSFWRNLFCKKELDEEEYTLLPTCSRRCPNKILKENRTTEKKDWWSRYYYSQKNYDYVEDENVIPQDKFMIYESELERQPQFSKFKDWCAKLKLYNCKKIGMSEKEEELQCGYLKVGIAIYTWPPPDNTSVVSANGVDLNRGYFHDYASNDSAKYLVRVYLIKGIDLITKNSSGKSHRFVTISCGSKQLGERSQIIQNTPNPIIGTVYEFRCTLPEEYFLKVSIYNHDLNEPNELIGSTTIDLENRIYTKHRARVGLASEYSLSEPGKWRDCIKPSIILAEMCAKNHLPVPSFPSISTVMFHGIEYKDNELAKSYASALECRENICLSLLHNWDSLPICGYALVPEHVETRNLYNPEIPGMKQGKIQMWIDIFPIDSGTRIPPPVDITPRKTEEYELKLTIFNVKLFGKDKLAKSSNLYVRVWTGFMNQMQNTSSHSVSSNGYYNFNWSMKFNFNYDDAERKLVTKEINKFTDFEEYVKPELNVQIMDSDSLSSDGQIGCLALNLNEMPQGERKEPECAINTNIKAKTINLFSVTYICGWWLFNANAENGTENVLGAIKLEVTLLPKQKPIVMPVGLESDLQSSLIQRTNSRLQGNSSQRIFDFKKFFYKHNAPWDSLTGFSFITVIIIVIIYFIIFM